MPLFEFFCETCRKKFEDLCGSGTTSQKCPGCGTDAKKVFSSFRTAGSGSGGGAAPAGGCGG